MYAEGWQKVQEGVLQRDRGEGFETFSYGAEGLQSVIQGYEQQVRFLEDRYAASPSEDLANALEKLDRRIDKLYEGLSAAPFAESFDAEALVTCTDIDPYGGTASASAMEAPRGVTAIASIYYHSNCGYAADIFAVAHAEASDGNGLTSQTDADPQQGTWIDGTATASMGGLSACYSYAQVQVILNGEAVYEKFDDHYGCPTEVEASVTGPAQVTTDYYGVSCADVTWTASANGGSEDFTYTWYIGEALEGTGSTLTKTYCNENATIAVRVVAQDSAGWSGDATFTTVINHIDPIVASASGPTSVTTDYYINSGCADVTWTASATGGHPGGHTYSWYIGTDPTVQGTGSTFTKSYCNTSQSVTMKVVAGDSDGHTDDETFTTTIQHIGPIVASASGPASVITDYYTNSGCANVTWTASATGGHAGGYTYSWYIGTDPTVQGTGSTFTKSYCNTSQSVTMKVVAGDSDGHTDDETFTTTIQHIGPIVASASGPTSVTTDYYINSGCADVTWTASATGGHPGGHTYSWYIGTDPTVQGTGSTFTKSYCNTSQSATVKVVAGDSDGHTDAETFTTVIQNIGPIVASASGPTSVTTDYYTNSGCANVTWTASATGGHPGGYTYSWYIGTDPTVQGTGSTFTKTYCNTSQSVTVKVGASDSDGHTGDAPFVTSIINKGRITARVSGPTSVTTNSSSPCATVTWTASATSTGHSGFTYKWYIGTALQASGATFSKQYCSTSQSVTVKVVALASDGHEDPDTLTTTITHTLPPTASISGPASVQLTTSTECKSITWTAGATGGTSGYTYSWYIGTSTTVQGTAATLTKSYCGPQTINVKVVVRDSAAQTDDATFTTRLSVPTPPTASISGPATVQLATSTECKSITWTAGATGGTPGYTYSWYLGTSTTVQGTAATLTKSYCGPQTINVKVVVRDSAAQTDDATFTTTLSAPTLTASISGQDYVDIYGATACADLTWSANVSGGTPAYTYSWTIGTSTTVLSTTSTLTKRVCTSQTLNVKLTARDSAARTANATFTTTVVKDSTCFANCP